MFDKFIKHTGFKERYQLNNIKNDSIPCEIRKLLSMFAGETFNNGLYRIHKESNIEKWNQNIFEMYPNFRNTICCFGYDWLGRQFATCNYSNDIVLMFEPGTGEVLEIPCNIIEFHEIEIVEHSDAALASMFFDEWIKFSSGSFITFDQCIGYKIPLFLGGEDSVENLELIDLDVYWNLCLQLKSKIE